MSYGEASYGEVSYGESPASGPLIVSDTLSDALSLPDAHSSLQIFVSTLADALSALDAPAGDVYSVLVEAFSLNDTAAYDLAAVLLETLRLGDSYAQDSILNPLLTDALRHTDATYLLYAELLSDALVATDTAGYVKFWTNRLRDTLRLPDSAAAESTYNYLVASALAFSDLAAHWDYETLSDSLSVADTLVGATRVYKRLVDSMVAGDATSFLGLVVTSLTDSLAHADGVSRESIYAALLEDDLQFVLWDADSQAGYVGYVMNPAVGGVTQYTNYNFNSIAKIGSSFYGASNTGLYKLTGDDDAGTDIDLRVKLGAFDFGAGYKSRVEQAYIGVRTDGKIIVKTFADDGNERWYETQAVHGDLSTQRAKLGRGVTSRYWVFEITNRDGAAMEVEQIEFLPVVLTRRV